MAVTLARQAIFADHASMTLFTQPYHDALAQLTTMGAPFEITSVDSPSGPVLAFANAASDLRSFMAGGRDHGDKLLLQYQGSTWTFNTFFRAADVLSRWLLDEHGLNSGDRVAIAMRNRPEWLIAFVAIINAGGVAVPLNSWGKSAELNQGLEDSDASLLICDPQRSQLVREINSDITQLVADFADGIDNARSLDTILAISKESPNTECDSLPAIGPTDPCILMFTSGTSGRPKGVLLSHHHCCQALTNLEFVGAVTYMTNQETVSKHLSSPVQPKTLLAVPLFHISGLFSQFIMNLRHGRSLYIMYKWDAVEALRLIKHEGVTVLMGAPVMMMELLKNEKFGEADAACLTNISAGGAATPEALFDLYRQKAGPALAGSGWGMTETMGTGAAFTGYFYEHRPGASGFPSPIMEFSFRDEQGRPVDAGEPGEIHVRSSAAIQGYHTGSFGDGAFEGGWLATGDIGYLSDEGLLYICGRVKDMIIRGGENIYPSEIEACLLTLSGCTEAAVVGVPSAQWGEEVAAVIRFDAGRNPTVGDVQAHCESHLAGFKVPRHVVFTEQELPRNATRKLLKPAIVAQYFASHDSN